MLIKIVSLTLSLFVYAQNNFIFGENTQPDLCDVTKLCKNGATWRRVRVFHKAYDIFNYGDIDAISSWNDKLIVMDSNGYITIQDSANKIVIGSKTRHPEDIYVNNGKIFAADSDKTIKEFNLDGELLSKIGLSFYPKYISVHNNRFYVNDDYQRIEQLSSDGTYIYTYLEKDDISSETSFTNIYDVNWALDGHAVVRTDKSILKIAENKSVIAKTDEKYNSVQGVFEDSFGNFAFSDYTNQMGAIIITNSNLEKECIIPLSFKPRAMAIMNNCSIALGSSYYSGGGYVGQVSIYESYIKAPPTTEQPSKATEAQTTTANLTTTELQIENTPTTPKSQTTGPIKVEDDCKPGWFKHNNSCYHQLDKKTGWFDAELTCREQDGHVTSISSQEEDAFLQALGLCRDPFWIGMVLRKSRDWKKTSSWYWWDDANHGYTELQIQNDVKRPSAVYENCVYHTQNKTWETDNCRIEKKFTCKRPTSKVANSKVSSICKQDWKEFGNSCYFLSENATNYFHALLACQEMGASVVTIHSREEHTFLQIMQGCINEIWIGLERTKPCLSTNKSMCWEWIDLKEVNYSDWIDKQPAVNLREECAVNAGGWKTMDCTLKRKYVCKMSK